MSDPNDLRSCFPFCSIPRNKMKSQLVAVLSNSLICSKLVTAVLVLFAYFTFQKEYPRSFVSYLKPVSETCTHDLWQTMAKRSFSNRPFLITRTLRNTLSRLTNVSQKIGEINGDYTWEKDNIITNKIVIRIILSRKEDFISSQKNGTKKERKKKGISSRMLSETTLHLAKDKNWVRILKLSNLDCHSFIYTSLCIPFIWIFILPFACSIKRAMRSNFLISPSIQPLLSCAGQFETEALFPEEIDAVALHNFQPLFTWRNVAVWRRPFFASTWKFLFLFLLLSFCSNGNLSPSFSLVFRFDYLFFFFYGDTLILTSTTDLLLFKIHIYIYPLFIIWSFPKRCLLTRMLQRDEWKGKIFKMAREGKWNRKVNEKRSIVRDDLVTILFSIAKTDVTTSRRVTEPSPVHPVP